MASMPENNAAGGGVKHATASAADKWRLSKIEEELEKIEFNNSRMSNSGAVMLPGAKAGTLPRRNPQSSQYTWGNEAPVVYSHNKQDPGNYSQSITTQYYSGSSSTPNLDDPDDIYSQAVVKPAYSGSKVDSREAVKFITGKYDSLGRLKPMMATLSGVSSPQSLSGDLSNGSFGSADFPPPPPEGFAQMPASGMSSPQMQMGSPQMQMYSPHMQMASPQMQMVSPQMQMASPQMQMASPQMQMSSPQMQLASPRMQMSSPQMQRSSPQMHRSLSSPSRSPIKSASPSHRPPPTQHQPQQAHIDHDHMVQHIADCGHIPPLTEQELTQIEMFYRSHKTEVFVCQSLVNMYLGSIRSASSPVHSCCREPGHWDFYKSGIPVLILDSGESRRKRRLYITLAERGTGFSLWRDSMNHLTNYSSPQTTFHTMHLSNDHTKLAGFRYVDAGGAVEFFHRIMSFVSDPNDDIMNLGAGKNKKKLWSKSKEKKKKLPTKNDISTPCCFTHITKLDRTDGMSLVAGPAQPQRRPTRDLPPIPMKHGSGYRTS